MPAIATSDLRIYNAEQFIEAFSETGNDTFYMFIGKNDPFSGASPGEYKRNTATVGTPSNINFIDGGGGNDQITLTGATWNITTDNILVVSNANTPANNGTYTIISATSTTVDIATASLTTDATDTQAILEQEYDDLTPPVPFDSIVNDYIDDAQMIGHKRITSGDINHVIPRINWTTATLYTQWDSEVDDMTTTGNHYVMNSTFDIYKCIGNNSGVNSTVEPTGTSTNIVETADFYRWKYLYTISAGDAEKFLSTSWMPVNINGTVQSAALEGTIGNIRIDNGGTGYADPADIGASITIVLGPGQSMTTPATATIAAVSAGAVTRVSITAEGTPAGSDTGYKQGSLATFPAPIGGGTTATGTIMLAPTGGHGNNAIEELGGVNAMLNVKLIDDEGTLLPVGDDFRKVGLMVNPLDTGAKETATVVTGNPVDAYTGRILYRENKVPILRGATQTEDIKLIITF